MAGNLRGIGGIASPRLSLYQLVKNSRWACSAVVDVIKKRKSCLFRNRTLIVHPITIAIPTEQSWILMSLVYLNKTNWEFTYYNIYTAYRTCKIIMPTQIFTFTSFILFIAVITQSKVGKVKLSP